MKITLPWTRTDILPLTCLGLIVIYLPVASYTVVRMNGIQKKVDRLAATPPATLYQTCQGEPLIGEAYPYNYRRDSLVKSYVQKWAENQFTWSGVIKKNHQKIRDPGVPIDRDKLGDLKTPTAAYMASFAFAENLQESYLTYLAKQWVASDYYTDNPTTTKLEVKQISPVEKVQINQQENVFYSVKISAILKEYKSARPIGSQRVWQREIIVRSIIPPATAPNEVSTVYERFSYEWKKYGLEIYDIKPYK